MEETGFDNISQRTRFGAAVGEEKKSGVLQQINKGVAEEREKIETQHVFGYSLRELSTTEQEDLNQMIATTGQKLEALGLENVQAILPQLEQMIIVDVDSQNRYQKGNESVDGGLSLYGEYIRINLPKEMKITDPQVKRAIFHELSHFVSTQVIKIDSQENQGFRPGALGFNRSVIDKETGRENMRGIWEESTAELFALFCLDQDIEATTVYRIQFPFMLSFVEKLADLKGDLSTFEAFKLIYKGKTTRDFNVQRELVEAFGSEVVRKINNIIADPGIRDENEIIEIASLGGFQDRYKELQEKIDTGSVSIAEIIPEIQGRIKKDTSFVAE